MRIQFFDVEHGACALLTSDDNKRMMFDCGHNSDTDWRPGTYLKKEGISRLELLSITNYDEDHASGSVDLFDNIDVQWLMRNKSVSTDILKKLKSDTGMGIGINRLCYEIDNTFNGTSTAGGVSTFPSFAGLEERTNFYNSYPLFDDENNLSMAVFLKCHGRGVIFTGDLEKAGFAELLKREDFRQALRQTNVYVASHHGRESGCSDEVAALLTQCYYVIISDKGYAHETQKTIPFYYNIAKGGPFRGETRYVLTARNDGRIGFSFSADGWGPY